MANFSPITLSTNSSQWYELSLSKSVIAFLPSSFFEQSSSSPVFSAIYDIGYFGIYIPSPAEIVSVPWVYSFRVLYKSIPNSKTSFQAPTTNTSSPPEYIIAIFLVSFSSTPLSKHGILYSPFFNILLISYLKKCVSFLENAADFDNVCVLFSNPPTKAFPRLSISPLSTPSLLIPTPPLTKFSKVSASW